MDKPSPFKKPLGQSTGMRFTDMTGRQKWTFVAKLIACIGTFGYAFPNVSVE